ncbi:Subtilisin-like serine protease [Lachnellula hyalina]|uniref:Subtilisin-like serine protease n=1 Tax=Lachnellula hyalina TaxID=1316788 RepID=A0A8H8U154_9HELO|nr:Subtilisin-like serine protease [Lachnellula hyalina]TVY27562.1 Subtilisin-like serine protease [Lachnellula hyalina]
MSYGLLQLLDPANAMVDIVFIHGAQGDRITTWTKSGIFWPKDFLLHDVPRARIFTFGYDAKVDHFWDPSQIEIDRHAHDLVESLIKHRHRTETNDRPIIFVAHSLGGLVCKIAVVMAETSPDKDIVAKRTHGIIFFGTPHEGSSQARWAETGRKFTKLFGLDSNQDTAKLLEGSARLSEREGTFIKFLHLSRYAESKGVNSNVQVACFFEEFASPLVDTIVSSTILHGYEALSIPANHQEMCKFTSRDEVGYKKVLRLLGRWMKELASRGETKRGKDDTETKPEQGPVTASELQTPETTSDWGTLSSYFQGPAAKVHEPSDTIAGDTKVIPPHVWFINQHAEDIIVVVSKYRLGHLLSGVTPDTSDTGGDVKFSNTSFLGPATRKTLPPHARDPERSSAVFPFWTREDGFGVISIFTGPDKILCLENDQVSAGSWIYLKREPDSDILEYDEATSPKSTPLFPIEINGNTIDLEIEGATGSSAQSNYILVQSWMPLALSQMKELESIGLSLHRQGYKISGSLGKAARSPQGRHSRIPHEVDIVFHDDVKPAGLRKSIAEMAHLRADTPVRSTQTSAHDPRAIPIRAIVKVHKLESRSHVAREILRADVRGDPGSQPNHTYEGKDEVVAVADTGFDSGHIKNIHHAFLDQQADLIESRILSIYPLSNIPLVNDFDGHGTHVCGLAVGNGTTRQGVEIKGTAPRAKLVVQCLGPDFNGVPSALVDLFGPPYNNNGARVHINSWGFGWSGTQLRYGEANRAEDIGQFVWDNPDMMICIAAGNNNNPYNPKSPRKQIGAEAAAKNCITVGATDNDLDYRDEVAYFSSRGPTVERRIKLDVVGPGILVLSANFAHQRRPAYPYDDPYWCFMNGTSMANPLVAGCAAVLREAVHAQAFSPTALCLCMELSQLNPWDWRCHSPSTGIKR